MQRRYGVTIKDAPTALWEASDLANGGTSVAGSFIQTLPLVNRDGSHVVEAIKRAQSLFPWLLRGVDFDNDSAFMNELVVPWCREQKLEVTRSRGRARRDLLQAMDKLEADGQPPATSASDFHSRTSPGPLWRAPARSSSR